MADTTLDRGAPVRTAPMLVAVFVLVMVMGVPDVSGSPVVGLLLSAALVAVTWIGANVLRRRPPLASVKRIGWPEAAVFVAVPTLAVGFSPKESDVFESLGLSGLEYRVVAAGVVFIFQLLILGLMMVVVHTGLLSLSVWLGREVIRSFAQTGQALGRTLPLLLGVVTFIFFTNEIWQSFGLLRSWGLAVAIGMFVALTIAFMSRRTSVEVPVLARFNSAEELDAALRPSGMARPASIDFPVDTPLSTRQKRNLGLVAGISRLSLATVVAVAVFVFFIVLGFVAVDSNAVKTWSGEDAEIIWSWSTRVRTYSLSWQAVRVSLFLAAFSGFYFSVASATDANFREDLKDTAEDAIREACAARVAALAVYPAPTASTTD